MKLYLISSGAPTLSLSRKQLSEAFWNGELANELLERTASQEFPITKDQSRECVMKAIDELRRHEVYPHPEEFCSPLCREKGTLTLTHFSADCSI